MSTIAPTFISAATSTDGTKIILTYSETLATTTAAGSAFSVITGSNANAVTGASVSGNTVVLTLTTTITSAQAVTVAYTAPTANDTVATNAAVQDIAGNDAASISTPATVTNNSTVISPTYANTVIGVTTSVTLPVITKYAAILAEMFEEDSVYVRTKDTLVELIASGDLSSADKAKVITEVLGNLNNSLVNTSLSTALQWTKEEAELGLQKEKLTYDLALIAAQTLLTSSNRAKTDSDKIVSDKQQNLLIKQAEKTASEKLLVDANKTIATNEALKIVAETKKVTTDATATAVQTGALYGTVTVDANGSITAINRAGSKIEAEIDILIQEELNKKAEENVLKSRLRESQATVYKIAADSAANYGTGFSVLATDTGISVTGTIGANSLSHYQMELAKEQTKGYAYNAWANGVNASSTAVSMLLAADDLGGKAIENLGVFQTYLNVGLHNLINTKPGQCLAPTDV
jgi:uncharacterized repeat protein (TIGR02059 family)